MKIYLAGKIGKNDWRHKIVRGLREICNDQDMHNGFGLKWPIMEKAIFQEHDYVGPYFIGCNHGCFHAKNGHGIFQTRYCDTPFKYTQEWEHKNKIIELCQKTISQCDLFFANIEDMTAYGTLVEIGMAKAMKIPIYIYIKDYKKNKVFKDIWFGFLSGCFDYKSTNVEQALIKAIAGGKYAR